MLGAGQQERYARHLLVDEIGGAGQERLVAGEALVQLPAEAAAAALWATRYLAASGVGSLWLDGPWAGPAALECARLWPEVRVREGPGPVSAGAIRIAEGAAGPSDVTVVARSLPAARAAALGARAALEVLKRIAGAGRPAELPLRDEDSP